MLRVRLVGRIAAAVDGREVPEPASRRAWTVLAWLALHPGLHSRAEVAARLWPDVPDASARQSMRSALWSLRQVLDHQDVLTTTRDRVGLSADTEVDALEFERLLDEGDVEAAVLVGEGELLPGIDDEWALVARDEHRQRLVRAFAELAQRAPPPGAVGWARRAAALDPLSEEAARLLMRSLAAAGDRPAALAEYRRFAARLRRELRLAPSEPTWRLAERIRTEVPVAPVAHSRPGLLPLVGRGTELRELTAAWTATRAGHGGLAVVAGEPGIGKTRLVAQLVDIAGADGGITVVGAAPDLAGPPLAPWVEVCSALAAACGPLPDEPWVQPLAPLVPSKVVPRSVSEPPDLAQSRLFEAAVALLERAARDAPVLVVLEDLHAADEASLLLLAHAARRVAENPVLLVATSRSRPSRDHLTVLVHASRQRGTLRADVRLAPLDGDAVAALARSVASLDDTAVEQIVAAAEGNALLAVEAARALAAGDALPVGLRGAVRAATARLSAPARELVSMLAVAGRDLDTAEAEALVGGPLGEAVAAGEDEGLLECVGHRVRFRHALLREAVYADLPAVERTARHRAAADFLAGDPVRAAEAGAHLRAAGRRAEAGAVLLSAAAQARAVGALADATELLYEARAALPASAPAAMELADVLAWRGRPEDAREAFDDAVALIERSGDPVALATAHLRFAEWHFGPICRPAVAMRACRRALVVLDGAGVDAPDVRAQVLAGYGWSASIGGDLADAERALDALAEVAGEEPDDPLLRCAGERTRCLVLLRHGRFGEAVEPGLRSAAAAREVNRPDLVYTGLGNAAFAFAAAGNLDSALALLDRIMTEIRGHGMLAIEALVLIDRAWVLVRQRRFPEADEAAALARRAADHLAAPALQALVDAERGRVALRAGDHATAARLLAEALAEPAAEISRPLARLQRAEALARLGRVDEAEAELAAVATEPVRTGDWPDTLVARMSAVEGLVARARGRTEVAHRHLTAAAAGWRRRMSAAELGRQLGAVMVDLGRPIIGIVVPAEELALVEADLAALPVPTEV